MDLESKLKEPFGKSFTKIERYKPSSKLFDYALTGYLALNSLIGFGCHKGGGSDPVPIPVPTPQNRSPVISSTLKTSADEGDNFFDKITAADADNDTLTYSLTKSPNGMTINNSDGSISWADAKEGNYPLEVKVADNKGGSAVQSGTLVVNNKFDDLSGKVIDILSGSNANNVAVALGHRDSSGNFAADFTNTTDINGNYLFSRIPTGVDRLVKLFNNPNYNAHLAGKLKSTSNIIDLNFEVIPTSFNMNFYNEVARYAGRDLNGQVILGPTQRWLNVPSVYINTSPALGSNIQPTQAQINMAVDIFKNELPKFNNGFTTNNINITIGTNPPDYSAPGVIRFEWDDSRVGGIFGAHGELLNGNEIINANADVRTDMAAPFEKFVYMQEITQPFGGRNDSNLEDSIFNSPPQSSINIDKYKQVDLDLGKILYRRPVNNKSINGTPDANPDDYRIR